MSRTLSLVIVFFLLSILAPVSHGYALLTHEAIIDSAWDPAIEPLLLAHFPGATSDQLKEAHAYAYGGAVIQDMGYYPFGSKLFSDLAHYVRSGDFVLALLRDSKTLDDYGPCPARSRTQRARRFYHGLHSRRPNVKLGGPCDSFRESS